MEEALEKIITILDSACLKIFDDTLQTILLCDASLKVMGEALLQVDKNGKEVLIGLNSKLLKIMNYLGQFQKKNLHQYSII